ncbi:MAG: bifunctional folylpolyglutamate synthase/dihydrofolate synthase [Planctomycetota bacterium]|jgi:dihydrofolate synthase/folylpolyglutamate synthase
MSFRTYKDVLAFLARTTNYERMAPVRATRRTFNLRRAARVLESLGNPQERFRSLHIAGTKGKGSAAIFAEAVLRAHGARTGLFTSPHLVDMMERIRIGDVPVSRRAFVDVMRRMKRAADRVRPTYFEIMTAAAFALFAHRKVDVAVVEVGLGGRLDATNLLRPAGCAITRIDYDHTATLGTTLCAIAREKAGILKRGVPAVVAPQRPAAMRAIRRAALRAGAPLREPPEVGRSATCAARGGFVLECRVDGTPFRVPVAGTHQAVNLAVALGLVRSVEDPPAATIRRALRSVRLPGRIELVQRRPDVVVDVAHNPASAGVLRATLDRVLPKRKRILVFGAPGDKDLRGMLRELLPGTRLAIFTRSADPRAAAPEGLAEMAGRVPAVVMESVARAVDLARRIARPREVVVVAGSFAVAGEAVARIG